MQSKKRHAPDAPGLATELKKRALPSTEQSLLPGCEELSDATTAEASERRVGLRVNHGIHTGVYPVVGLRVSQVRRLVQPFMNIDPDAVAVIGATIVENEDEHLVVESDHMIHFVKKSSVKGAVKGPALLGNGSSTVENIVLQNGSATLHLEDASPRQLPAREIIRTVEKQALLGLTEEPIPETVRWRIVCGDLEVYLVELKPDLRLIRWLSAASPKPYGDDATYEDYRLATPFVIIKVPFVKGQVHHTCEVFYRNSALRHLDDELYFSNLLNVSPDAYGCRAWFCTVKLDEELERLTLGDGKPNASVHDKLDTVLAHLFGGGFNLSSEHNEGKSCFSKARDDGLDERVTDVKRWQKASLEDPRFVLEVPWTRTGRTVRQILLGQLELCGLPRDLSKTSELINLLLAGH
jgi:hypothetical protein